MSGHESVLATAKLLNITQSRRPPGVYEELKKYAGMSIPESVAAQDMEAAEKFGHLMNIGADFDGSDNLVNRITDEEIGRLLENEDDESGTRQEGYVAKIDGSPVARIRQAQSGSHLATLSWTTECR